MLRVNRSSIWGASRHFNPSRRNALPSARRGYASVTDLKNYPQPGEQLHGFTLKRAKHVPELELTALHLEHEKTGAGYLHVARDDSNNVFSIGFKTNPPDDTGVPHILEHTTLCGSKKFPVRDPFFKMLPRSLSNFMNAMTASDHTFYPFATTNAQDFRNLMSVYLDATLHPLLKASDFTQEGWRIGPENPLAAQQANTIDAVDRRLVFKGVVYNEMKGQMSDAGYLYYIRFQDHLFPDINNSGGDPQKMTELTHEQLKTFHAEHYNPSNAKVFTYGNLPLRDHLQELDASLNKFNKTATDHDIKSPIDLSQGPKFVSVKGPVDPLVPPEAQYKTSMTWLTTDTSNILESFSLGVVTSLLTDGYGSPLYRGLIEAGLGADWSPNTGSDTAGSMGVFSVGLTGVKQENVPKVKEAITKTLREVKEQGFSKTKVDGILHQLELGLKHKTAQFGMGLMSRLKPAWFNGVDPFDSLAVQETIDAFKKEYAKEGYLERLLEKYFMNDHTLIFTMEPSETYAQEIADEETERLASKILETTQQFPSEENAREYLEKRELDLLAEQEAGRNQDLSVLPTVHVKDIPRQKEKKELRHAHIGDVRVQWREAPTNGLTYLRAIQKLDGLPDDLRALMPLFSDAIMRLGTKNQTMEQIEEQIKLKTGGVSVGYHLASSPTSLEGYEEGVAMSGSAFHANMPAMYDILRALIFDTDFDSPLAERNIRQLLQASASNAVSAVAETGHAYARRYADSSLTPSAYLREQVSGLTQVNLITTLASRPENASLADVISKLKKIQSFAISNSRSLRVALTCDRESSSSNEAALKSFLSALPTINPNLKPNATNLTFPRTSKSFFPLPYQVYYGGLSLPTVPYTHASGASLQILSQLLTYKYMHPEIREKGGAYGGGASASGLGGVFGFFSYRDPNPANTLRVMQGAGHWALEQEFSDRDLEEAKLSVFQRIDAPQSVSAEGMTAFVDGVSDEMVQMRREQLLDVRANNVRDVAEEFLVKGLDKASITFLGEKSDWIKDGDWETRNLNMASSNEAIDEDGLAAASQ